MLSATAPRQADLVEALSRPGLHGGRTVEHLETHVSHVFLAGGRVLKLKKAVRLPFADLSTLERRRWMCQEEVRLNRRLAPDVYAGVRAIAVRDGAFALSDAADRDAVEYVVEMRRLAERDSLASRIERGALTPDDVRLVARRLAEFHRGAERVPAERAVSALERSSRETFDTLLDIAPSKLRADVEEGARFAGAYLASHASELRDRARAGRFVEGHGDLRAEHVFIERGRVQVIDCAELQPRLHELDAAADLAFLVMDLERLGAPELARELVDAYRAAGGDPGSDDLVAFHAADRAWIRAKVALIRAAELPYGAPEAQLEAAEARAHAALARRFAWRARGPVALVVCGGAATGKSTLAAALAHASGLEVIGSDRARKALAGLAPTDRGGGALYSAEMDRWTYAELAARAAAALDGGSGVIVDATFRRAAAREALVRAVGGSGRVVFLECRAPAQVVAERARRREAEPNRVSDAGRAVALRHRSEFEPVTSAEPGEHLVLTTTSPPEELVRRIESAVGPAGRGQTTDPAPGGPPMLPAAAAARVAP